MSTLTIEILNPKARSILDGLEDAGLIAIGEPSKSLEKLGEEFWRKKSVDELAKEQGVDPVDDLDRLFGCGKDLWETEGEWNDYLESIQSGRNEKG